MLTTHLFSKSIKTQITLPRQWLHITLIVLRSNSSSSDSSDSDSDSTSSNKYTIGKNRNIAEENNDKLTHNVKNKMTFKEYLQVEKKKQIEMRLTKAAKVLTTTKKQNTNTNIPSSILDQIFSIQSTNISKKLHKSDKDYFKNKQLVKKYVDRKYRKEHEVKENPVLTKMLLSQKENIIKANRYKMNSEVHKVSPTIQMKEKDIANEQETPCVNKNDLQKKLSIQNMVKRKKMEETTKNVDNYRSRSKMQGRPKYLQKAAESTNNFERDKRMKVYSINRTVQNQEVEKDNISKFAKNYEYRGTVSTTNTIQSGKTQTISDINKRGEMERIQEYLKYTRIFTNDFTKSSPTPELKIWELCQKKEIDIIMNTFPKNGFEEMIQWTEEGKLWKFPIDNEQGMEEEQNVHFAKHVFLEHHLEEWCPTKGPIRHFMELVCNGLSKNPYMTIEEKCNHIIWYKDYFNGKKDLLHKLGLTE